MLIPSERYVSVFLFYIDVHLISTGAIYLFSNLLDYNSIPLLKITTVNILFVQMENILIFAQ